MVRSDVVRRTQSADPKNVRCGRTLGREAEADRDRTNNRYGIGGWSVEDADGRRDHRAEIRADCGSEEPTATSGPDPRIKEPAIKFKCES